MRSMSCSGTQITCFTSTKVQILTNTELQQSYMQQSTMRRIAIFCKSYMLQQRCCSSVAALLQHLYRGAVCFSMILLLLQYTTHIALLQLCCSTFIEKLSVSRPAFVLSQRFLPSFWPPFIHYLILSWNRSNAGLQ